MEQQSLIENENATENETETETEGALVPTAPVSPALMTPEEMLAALETNAAEAAPVVDLGDLLKLQQGAWCVGADDEEVDIRVFRAIVDPHSFRHGWRVWPSDEDGNKLKAITHSVAYTERRPSKPAPIDSFNDRGEAVKLDFKPYYEFDLVVFQHTDESDVGRKLSFKTDSSYGQDIYAQITAGLARHIRKNGPEFCCPVVTLSTSSYKHKQYGKIMKGHMDIVNWATEASHEARFMSQGGDAWTEETEGAAPAAPAKKASRKR